MLSTPDPRFGNILVDANALDRGHADRDRLLYRFAALRDAGEISVVVPESVLHETSHPNTPAPVAQQIRSHLHMQPTKRTSDKRETLDRINAVLAGSARPRKHAADAEHVFEGVKYGGRYFITNDKRIVTKRNELLPLIAPLYIVTLE